MRVNNDRRTAARSTFAEKLAEMDRDSRSVLSDSVEDISTEALVRLGKLLADHPHDSLAAIVSDDTDESRSMVRVIASCAAMSMLQVVIDRANKSFESGDTDSILDTLKALDGGERG